MEGLLVRGWSSCVEIRLEEIRPGIVEKTVEDDETYRNCATEDEFLDWSRRNAIWMRTEKQSQRARPTT